MNIFGRRRKESSQSTPGGGRSLLSASLPATSGKKGSKSSTTPISGSNNNNNNVGVSPPLVPGKENYPPGNNGHGGLPHPPPSGMKHRAHHATAPAAHSHIHGPGNHTETIHINELGRMQQSPTTYYAPPRTSSSTYTAPPAFTLPGSGKKAGRPGTADGNGYGNNNSTRNLPAIPRDPSSKKDLNKQGLPNPTTTNRRMSTGSIPSIDAGRLGGTAAFAMNSFSNGNGNGNGNGLGEIAELQLCYGYWPIETQRDLNLVQVEEIVRLCGQDIRQRGIEAPLLFSTKALDITMEGICSLIRAYVGNRDAWRRDLKFASPHDLCGMIKWALGRYINPQGGRGFLAWEMYERWRFGEREKEFPPRYVTTHMLYLLPTQNAALLTTLFSLMSSALAYTAKNGCTVRKLATLFSSYIFGLPDDGTFEHTYTAFNRFSHATEHLLLAFLRDQIYQHEASGAVMSIPVRLRDSIKDYPACLPRNLNKPPQGAELQQVVRIRRHIRWYSKNLIATAGTWEVPRSKAWSLIGPLNLGNVSEDNKPSEFAYSGNYKHLMNIRNITDEEDEEELQKFKSIVEKEWKSFMYSGFAPPDDSKLKFDLTESDRANRRRKHETIDWTTFESSGFHGREIFLPVDLNFNPGANDPLHLQHKDDLLTEAHAKLNADRARTIEKSLPPFNYDITPREERSIQIDKQFLEVYSDVLCSSGWTREEMKESNWALVHFKTRSLSPDRPLSAGSDGRTEETWFLIEEIVPSDYRASLLEQAQAKPKTSRRISFLRPVRKKQSKLPAMPEISGPLGIFNRSTDSVNQRTKLSLSPFRQNTSSNNRSGSPNLKTPDDSVFTSGPTKMMKLSKSISSVGPSKASSAAGHGDEDLEALDAPPVIIEKDEVHRAPHINNQAGIGYTKPNAGTGNAFLDMVRKTTRRNRRSFTAPADNPLQDGRHEPPSPASTVQPGSPGFNLNEHGVSGPGRTLDTPNEWMDRMARMSRPELPSQRYDRAPASFTGSFETRVTSGHSDTSTMHPVPALEEANAADVSMISQRNSEARDSASIYDRDLPPPPPVEKRDINHNNTDPAYQDAEEVVEVDSRNSGDANRSDGSIDPYDGMADDEDTSGEAAMPSFESRPNTSTKDLPEPIDTTLSSTVSNGTRHVANPSMTSVSPTSPSSLIPRPLRSTSTSQPPDVKGKPLPSPQDIQELLMRPTIPINGTGKVSQLAGKYGSISAKPAKPVA